MSLPATEGIDTPVWMGSVDIGIREQIFMRAKDTHTKEEVKAEGS